MPGRDVLAYWLGERNEIPPTPARVARWFVADPRGFAGDPRARDLVRRTTGQELKRLHPLERYFLLLPWMHSESIDDQYLGEAAYAEAASDLPDAFRSLFESGGDFATRHRRVIERFGRFPHRNAVLGRESTPEELDFMEAHGTGF